MIPGSIGARYQAGETVAEIARDLGYRPTKVLNVLRATGQLSTERVAEMYEQMGNMRSVAERIGVCPATVFRVIRRGAWEQRADNRPKCTRCGMLLAECGPARDEWGTPTDEPPHVDGVCWACRRELAFEAEHSVEIAALRVTMAMEEVA